MRRPTILIYCQHSLGLGHLMRTWALGEALAAEFRVVLAAGGEPPHGLHTPASFDVVDLPSLSADVTGQLSSADGDLESIKRRRAELLRAACQTFKPDVILIELFPFGRRKFRDEIITLIDESRRVCQPVVVSSVRDLLVARGHEQQAHDDRTREMLDRYFDLVLVHTDPLFATLGDTFVPTRSPAVPIRHTGFVVPSERQASFAGRRQGIVVSGGGGRFAETLYATAIQAHREWGEAAPSMTVVAGPLCPLDTLERIRDEARDCPGVQIERTVPDLCHRLRAAALSISQCGYNTALDLVRAAVPALVVPFNENGDSEQTDRARRLEQLGALRVYRGPATDSRALGDAMRSALAFHPASTALNLNGGAATTAMLKTIVMRRSGPSTTVIA